MPRRLASGIVVRVRVVLGPALPCKLVDRGVQVRVQHEDRACRPGEVAVEVRTLPEASTARTVHHGAYDEVGPACHAPFEWIQEHDRQPGGPPRETYLNDPREVTVDEQLTQVDIPLANA